MFREVVQVVAGTVMRSSRRTRPRSALNGQSESRGQTAAIATRLGAGNTRDLLNAAGSDEPTCWQAASQQTAIHLQKLEISVPNPLGASAGQCRAGTSRASRYWGCCPHLRAMRAIAWLILGRVVRRIPVRAHTPRLLIGVSRRIRWWRRWWVCPIDGGR
jgi:hypothetical protein